MRKRLPGKRYDNKGHLLHPREYQRRDGRYEYKYMTIFGERKSIYADTLQELRELEEGIDCGIKYCRCSLEKIKAEWACIAKARVSKKTFIAYECTYDRYIAPVFATKDVKKVTQMEIERFYLDLHASKHLKVSTVESVHTVLFQILEIARKKRLISFNPADGAISCLRQEKRREVGKKPKALSKELRNKFIVFLMTTCSDSALALLVCLMAITGCRCCEITGLTAADIDFEKNVIRINHSCSYGYSSYSTSRNLVECGFSISRAKTVSSERETPFEPSELFLKIKKQIKKNKRLPKIKIGSYKDFVFVKENGLPFSNKNVNNFLKTKVKKYNELEQARAKECHTSPLLMPENITSHVFRKTAATIMNNAGYQLPDIQNLLGHVDISTTVNRYCCPDLERAREVAKTLDFNDMD